MKEMISETDSAENSISQSLEIGDSRNPMDQGLRHVSREKAHRYFVPGQTVWRVVHSLRASWLVDAHAFYSALVSAFLMAEREIFIVGWDTDSRTELPRPADLPVRYLNLEGHFELGYFLAALTREKPELNVYILTWDFAFIYMLERESLPSLKFTSLESDRLRFVLDREHPALASHHQKIVSIDRRVAFSGGLDITQRRWDTPEHKGDDPRRVDPGGRKYGPFHDVQFCVDGETAESLSEIARDRWMAATGFAVPALAPLACSEFPARVEMRDLPVAISRTLPQEGIHEVEALFLRAIESIQEFAYIENQYFTSPLIAEALAKRLSEEDGPEIVLVLPRDETGWIEESTMGLLRAEALKTVRRADLQNRFRCYYPVVPNLGSGYVKIHSKVMIIDDAFLRIGSANMNGRSMGVDTECDLSVDASGRADLRQSIRALRESLLAEHLGVSAEEVSKRFSETGSLIQTVESLRKRKQSNVRTLNELEAQIPEWVESLAPPADWIDPSEPRGIRRWIRARIEDNRLAFIISSCLVSLALLGLWMTSEDLHPVQLVRSASTLINQTVIPWWRSVDSTKVARSIEAIRGEWWSTPAVLFGFVAATFLWIPITVLIMGIALSFSSSEAFFLSIGGALSASLVGYGIGRYWAFTKSRILSRPWVRKASEHLSHGGLWKVVLVRLLPIAPFMVVNVVAGGLRVRLRDFALGSFLGLLPGILIITVLSQTFAEILRGDSSHRWQLALGTILLFGVIFFVIPSLWSALRRRQKNATL